MTPIAMESINAEWEVIELIEKELKNRKKAEGFRHRFNRLKNLAYTIQTMINTEQADDRYLHKGTDILCKQLGTLWQEVFNTPD